MSSLKSLVELTYLDGGLGPRVSRAAAADPQNAWLTLFTISGGPIIVTALIGVRTVIQAGGASTIQFRHSVGPTVLDTGITAITGDTVNTLYYVTGDAGDAVIAAVGGVPLPTGKVVATAAQYNGIGLILSAGNIQVTMTAAAGTGSTRYVLSYIPLDPASAVVAA